MKKTAVLKSSGTGDLPDVITFYLDGKAYMMYFAPEGPNRQKIESGKMMIVDYTKESLLRLGTSVTDIQDVVFAWTANLYRMTSRLNPPVYYIRKMYQSSADNKIRVNVHSYIKGESQYQLEIDPKTLKIVKVVTLE